MDNDDIELNEQMTVEDFLADMPGILLPKLTLLVETLQGASHLQNTPDIFLHDIDLVNTGIDAAEIYLLLIKLEDAGFIKLSAFINSDPDTWVTNTDTSGHYLIQVAVETKLAKGDKETTTIVKTRLYDKFFKLVKNISRRTTATHSASRNAGRTSILLRDDEGTYTLNNKTIDVEKNTEYYKIFDSAFLSLDQNNFTSYERTESMLVKMYKFTPSSNHEQRNYRIRNGISNSQGFFKYAKINGAPISNEVPHKPGIKLVKIIRGEGLKFNTD